MSDDVRGVTLELDIAPVTMVFRYPIETVSLSNDGPDRVFQGTRLFLLWPLGDEPNRFECAIDAARAPAAKPSPFTSLDNRRCTTPR